MNDWLASITSTSLMENILAALIAAPFIWLLSWLARRLLRGAKGFANSHFETIDVAVKRYAQSDGFAQITFQNYVTSLLRKSNGEMIFNGSMLAAACSQLPAAKDSVAIASFFVVFAGVFAWRLFSSIGTHVRNQMLEEAMYDHVSIEQTKALILKSRAAAQHGDTASPR